MSKEQQLPPFRSVEKCEKCLASAEDALTRYINGSGRRLITESGLRIAGETMVRQCSNCDFEWLEQPADAKESDQ